jgi:hypothetical protein
VTGPTWRCSACDTYNDAGLRACEICGTAKSVATAAAKSAPKPAAKRAPSGSARAGAKRTPPAKGTPKRKAAPKSGTAGGGSTSRPAAAKSTGGGTPFRAGPEMARLLPEIFHPDGSVKSTSPFDAAAGPRAWGRIGPTVADGGVIDLVADPRPGPAGKPRGPAAKPKTGTKATPEPTRTDEVLGCGCLLVIVAAVITGIVLLVLHWSAIVHWKGIFAHSGHPHPSASATPYPTTTASGPCPAPLAAMLPKTEPAGARLVAVYSRKDITEEYAFCETTDKRFHFFGREGDTSKPFGSSGPATKITGGFDVTSTDDATSVTTDFRFVGGKVAAYEKDKLKWEATIVPKASVD